jgi:hypothetical protein
MDHMHTACVLMLDWVMVLALVLVRALRVAAMQESMQLGRDYSRPEMMFERG